MEKITEEVDIKTKFPRKTKYLLPELMIVAEELNKKIKALSPKIDIRGRTSYVLERDIEKVCTDVIEPGDAYILSNFTVKVLRELGAELRKPKRDVQDGTRSVPKEKRGGPRGDTTQNLIEFWTKRIKEEKYTRKDLIDAAIEEFAGKLSEGTIRANFSRGVTGNTHSNFKQIIKIHPVTKIASF